MIIFVKTNIKAMARIYVASSWRNQYYPAVVTRLREAGHEVYDFRNPPHGGTGFHWTDIDANAPSWTFAEYAEGLRSHFHKIKKKYDRKQLKKAISETTDDGFSF